MALGQEIADFTAFAMRLEQERGRGLSLDEAYQQWREIDRREVALLKERLASYDAGERGRPADEVMTELRAKLIARHGS